MAKKERFGKFVLLEELGSSSLGSEYRAAKLAAGGALERLVLLVRLGPALSTNHAFTSALLEQTKAASLLHGPNILKLIAIGRVESAYYVAYEQLEGKGLKAVLERSRREAFPFTPDHALAIASKLCAALEYAHGKQDAHGRHVHGLVTPGALFITHDGEVKLRGFGVWAAGAFKAGAIAADERGYLAPEQAKSGVAQIQTDVYGAGALLFEMLTGQPLVAEAVEADPSTRVKQARLAAGVEGEGLPQPMAEILARALAGEPAARFREMAEMRKAVDALLYSGEFNPTTFKLAFFMHSLFREDIERDARNAAEEAAASYTEYWVEDAPRPAPPPAAAAPATPVTPQPVAVPAPAPAVPTVAAHPEPAPSSAPRPEPPPRPREPFPALEMEGPPPTSASSPRHASISPASPRPELKSRSPLPLPAIAAALVVAGGAAAGWYFLAGPGARPPSPPPTTLSAETIAAQARVRELEAKLQRFEEEKAQAEARAAEEAKQKLEAQAAARGQAVDPAALRKAQEDARQRAQREQERKQQEERRLLEEQQQAAEARLAEERRRAAAAASAPATLAPAPPTTTPAPAPPPPTTLPTPAPLRPGTLVNIADFGVIPPTLDRAAPLVYPPIARQQRAEGIVELSVLIDEKGNVAEARIVKGAPGIGLNQSAIDNVRRRKYRPATKDGVPVKVYLPVIVRFEIPR